VLLIAQAMGRLKLGNVSLDWTKIKANASKHKALSFEHANRLEEQLKSEVDELMRLAEQADNAPLPEPLDIPSELKRREQRLAVIAAAKAEIEARALRGRASRVRAEARRARSPSRAHRQDARRQAALARPSPARGPRIRSASPTQSRASCLPPAEASSRPTTRRPASIPRRT
jgi:hypothetical protein